MSRLILKQHSRTRLQETSPLAIGMSVKALREPAIISWIRLHVQLGLRVPADSWERLEMYDAEMAGMLH